MQRQQNAVSAIVQQFRHCIFLFALLPLNFSSLAAQNLLPNPGFEDVNICSKYQEDCSPKAWRSTILKGIKYSSTNSAKAKAFEGQRYLQLLLYNPNRIKDRRFAMAPLLCPLEAGKTYELSLYFYTDRFSIATFGASFSDSLLVYPKNTPLLGQEPQVAFSFPKNIKQSKWTQVKGQFVAQGGEKVIIIGNFLADSLTHFQYFKGYSPKQLKKRYLSSAIYYGLDQLELRAVDGDAPPCDMEQAVALIYRDSIRHAYPPLQQTSVVIAPEKTLDTISLPSSPLPPIETPSINLEEVLILPDVQFASNRTDLVHEALPSLKKLVDVLEKYPDWQLEISGHTDNIGNADKNRSLSLQRAGAIRDFLLREGIEEERLAIRGWGEERPIANNATENGRQANRRVEFRFSQKQ